MGIYGFVSFTNWYVQGDVWRSVVEKQEGKQNVTSQLLKWKMAAVSITELKVF